MTLQIDFWQLLGMAGGALATILGCVIGLARWLASEYDRRQEMRFAEFQQVLADSNRKQAEALNQHVQSGQADIQRVAEYADRLTKVESEVVGHPTHKDIAALYESINTLAATVNQLVGETRLQSDLMRMLINREVSK